MGFFFPHDLRMMGRQMRDHQAEASSELPRHRTEGGVLRSDSSLSGALLLIGWCHPMAAILLGLPDKSLDAKEGKDLAPYK